MSPAALWADTRRICQVLWIAGIYLRRRKAPSWLGGRRGDPDAGPELAREMLQRMGGTFVKLGQLLALQPDILPPSYCIALSNLLDRMSPVSIAEIDRVLERELGKTREELFDRFETEPLATASIGQVHVAYLDGVKVAVKIQRPEAEEKFRSDIRIIGLFSSFARRWLPRSMYWIVHAFDEVVHWTGEELSYLQEARYTEQLTHLARNSRIQRAPKVFRACTTRRVLVTEFLQGTVLLDYLRAIEAGDPRADRLVPEGFDRRAFASNVIDNFLFDAFGKGFYHADLHPANLLILPENAVGYIDFGITGVISAHGRRHLSLMTLALATGDMDLFNRHFLPLAIFEKGSDPEAFRRGLDELAESWYEPEELSAGGRGGNAAGLSLRVNFTRIMVDLLRLSRRTDLLPERDIVKYIRSTIAIDGLVTRFEPDFHVGGYLAERCETYLTGLEWREKTTPGYLLDWAASQGKLLKDGPERLRRWARQSGPSEVDDDPAAASDSRSTTEPRRAFLLGALSCVLALPAAFSDPMPSGVLSPVWTAEVFLLGTTLLLLAVTLLRLTIQPKTARRTP